MIDDNLIGTATSRVLPIRRDRDSVNRIHVLRQRPPLQGRAGAHFALGALVNPKFDQAKLVRRQVRRVDLVILWRHGGLLLMRGCFQKKAVAALARHNGRARLAAFKNGLGGLEDQVGLGLGLVVTSQAIVFQHRQNLLFEIHRLGPLDFADGDGWGLGWLRSFGQGGERQKQRTEKNGQSAQPSIAINMFQRVHGLSHLAVTDEVANTIIRQLATEQSHIHALAGRKSPQRQKRLLT